MPLKKLDSKFEKKFVWMRKGERVIGTNKRGKVSDGKMRQPSYFIFYACQENLNNALIQL